jgi:hypothetical protein
MSHNMLLNSILTACLFTVVACDGIDDEQSGALVEQDEADESEDRRKVVDAPEELDPDAAPAWSELDIAAAEPGVDGPGGTSCCVDCGDGWGGWYNLGTADGCNSRAATFCHNNGWYFINAEWRYWC